MASRVAQTVPSKKWAFAPQMPRTDVGGQHSDWKYKPEDELRYVANYGESYFGITEKKAGWDCNRHYEILGAGTVPYFIDMDKSPSATMAWFPRSLVSEAMTMTGVTIHNSTHGSIDFNVFNKTRYFEIANELLQYTRQRLTSRAMAAEVLRLAGMEGAKSALYVNMAATDAGYYLRDELFVGFRELMQERLVDWTKETYMYNNVPDKEATASHLYGYGYAYAFEVPDITVDRSNIEERVAKHEFDVIIYGEIMKSHRDDPQIKFGKMQKYGDWSLPPNLWEVVTKHYKRHEILLLAGMDIWPWLHLDSHDKFAEGFVDVAKQGLLFLRESQNSCTPDYINVNGLNSLNVTGHIQQPLTSSNILGVPTNKFG